MNMNLTAINYSMLESQGIYLSQSTMPKANRTVFLFTGHGSQYPNMLKELAEIHPVVKNTLNEADEVYSRLTGRKLTDLIFYDNEDQKPVVEKNLSTAEVMQPSIIMANIAIYRLMKTICREADFHLGHSLGEIAALAAAEVFSFADALKIAYYRASSLNIIDSSARGSMISLKASRESAELKKVLEGVHDYYTISLHNSPDQVVISGTFQAIDKIAANCEAAKVTYNKLAVSHAFHSKLLEPAVEYFHKKLLEFTFQPPKVRVFSTILGDFYSDSKFTTETMASLLASQLVQPFSFCELVSRLHEEHGANVFIEVGPKDILTKLAKNILKDKQIYSHASNTAAIGDEASLERVIAYLTVNKLTGSYKEEAAIEMVTGVYGGENRNGVEEAIRDIVQLTTGYPLSTISISDKPVKLDLALNNKVFQTIIEKIRAEFDLDEHAIPMDSKISLLTISGTIKSILGLPETSIPIVHSAVLNSATAGQKEEVRQSPIEKGTASAVAVLNATAADKGEVEAKVKEIIQVKTGYPVDMLEGELDLEADLGIDSVKQAEIFGQIREKFGYDLNPDLNIKLFNTIDKIVEYTLGRLGETKTEAPEFVPEASISAAPVLPAISRGEVEVQVKEIIQVKTGYPVDMLEGELDLEADLGIDSVKQAEIFGQIREKFGYDLNPDLNIKQFNTIDKIVEYTLSRLGESPSGAVVTQTKELTDEQLLERIQKYSSEHVASRYVPVTVEREYDEALGRKFSFKGKNFIIVEDRLGGEVTSKLADLITNQGGGVSVISPDPVDLGRFKQSLEEAKARLTDVHGFIYLYPLSQGLSYMDSVDEQWYREVDNNFNFLFYTAKAVYEFVEKHGLEAGCFAATNIGGVFGIEMETSFNPLGALTAGFFKSMEKEIDSFNGKVVDLTDTSNSLQVAETLLKEFSLIEELIEIGYVNGRRKTIHVLPSEIEPARVNKPLKLGTDDVILVSGGGRGIIFESIKGLAEVFNPTIIVTGRTALPQGNEEWLHFSEEQFDAYSSEFFKKKKLENPRLTPIQIKQELEKLKGAAALYNNIQAMKEAGYNFHYLRCDVADRNSVRKLTEEIKTKFGKVTGIVNGAGLPSFGKVPKKPEEYSLTVVRVKANGFYNLYHEFADQPLKFFASIGSVSGRFGMDGQVDYAGGADIIVRMSFQLFRNRPEIKAFTMGWTAWDEVGMATDPQVQKIQKEQRGLEFISTNEGIQRFVSEIVYGGDYPEVLYYGSLGTNRPLGQMDILDDAGKNVIVHYGKHGEMTDRNKYPLIQRVKSISKSGLEIQKDLTVQEDIYLKDHLVEGKYVYAGVMHVEAFSELGVLLNQTNPEDSHLVGTRIHSVEFNKFVKYFEGSPLTLDMKAEVIARDSAHKEIKAEIRSDFYNRQGRLLEKDRLHSSGNVVFENQPLAPRKADADVIKAVKESKPMDIERFYALTDSFISFGPSFRCLDYVGYVSDEVVVGQVTVPDDRQIFSYTVHADTIISPITIDNIGRCMLLNDFHKNGNIIVPRGIGNAVLYRPFKKGEKVYVHCKLLRDQGETVDFHAQVVDENNNLIFDMMDLHLIRIAKENGDHNLL